MERSSLQLYVDRMGWDWLDGMVIKVVGSLRAPLVLIIMRLLIDKAVTD